MSCGSSKPDGCAAGDALLTGGLLSARSGTGVCPHCFDLTETAATQCASCARTEHHVKAMVPISYSVGGERLHHDIAAYKRLADPSVPAAIGRLSQLLANFLAVHEHCLAAAAAVPAFDVVTTVPSGSGNQTRDEHHPLRRIVAQITPTAARHERILLPAEHNSSKREFDPNRYRAARQLDGESVLLIDDMWTTGASVQSSAAALQAGGAGTVAAVVIGRHLNRGWADNDLRLRRLRGGFAWGSCPLCDGTRQSHAA